LKEAGADPVLVCREGSRNPFGDVHCVRFDEDYRAHLPQADILHFFATPPWDPPGPYLVTIGGNGRTGERYFQNTVFVSEDHARRHQAKHFVYNGIDPDEYAFREQKEDFLVFLAKASWR